LSAAGSVRLLNMARRVRRVLTINARGESVSEKPSFRAAFRRRRCIVHANDFYVWQQIAGEKQLFHIHPVGGEFFALGS
jgi:putative SOS response-associated peptidase YedK